MAAVDEVLSTTTSPFVPKHSRTPGSTAASSSFMNSLRCPIMGRAWAWRIFCRTWVDGLPKLPDAGTLMARWSRVLAVRAAVQKELETLRQGGRIGSSLQAEVAIGAGGDYDTLGPRRYASS
jgi:hypothetical protein